MFDRVGDVWNHLDRAAEIIAAPLLGDNVLIDATGGDIVHPIARIARKSLVMSEIQIGFGSVVGNEDLSMLGRGHRPRVNVQIRIEFSQSDCIASRLQQRSERCRCQTFSEGRNHAAGDENVPRHGTLLIGRTK